MVEWGKLLEHTEHRPWPLPSRPWLMTMSWVDLLFAHWRFDPSIIAAKLPDGLELDTFDGGAYLGLVPFRMENVGPRGLGWLPARLPGPRAFPELNVRTYVRCGGKAGVWFFSLDATDRLAVEGARWGFHLPYFKTRITMRHSAGWTEYNSQRVDKRCGPGELRMRYRPRGEVLTVESGSLGHFLTERYCLYAADHQGRILRGDIQHVPWPLYEAEAEIEVNTVTEAHGLALDRPHEPLLVHYAPRLDVVAWWPRQAPE